MSNYIYSVNTLEENEKDNDSRLASKGYVDAAIKQIEDILINYINKQNESDPGAEIAKPQFNKNNYSNGEDIIIKPEEKVIRSGDIVTDPLHRFIDDRLIRIFKEKPTRLDLDNAINAVRSDMQLSMKIYINDLINTPDALQRLHDFGNLLKEDDILDAITEILAKKVEFSDLNNHANNSTHLNNNDRKALNLLLGFIETGVADWNAAEGEPNYIANKPESLKADGGNADTIAGYGINSILNRRPYDIVLGNIEYVTSNDEADAITDANGNFRSDDISWTGIINNNSYNNFFFKPGLYNFADGIIINSSDKIKYINGSGIDTILVVSDNENNKITLNNIYMRDLTIRNCAVDITGYIDLSGITFIDCTIYIHNGERIRINNCSFDRCVWTISSVPPMYGLIITNNIISGTYNNRVPSFNLRQCLISNNLDLTS